MGVAYEKAILLQQASGRRKIQYMIAGMTYYEIAWYFLIYSFFGWCVEVIYHALKIGKVINRGFLNGPVCPVYGFGVLSVFSLTKTLLPSLNAVFDNHAADTGSFTELFILFILGMILTTVVELVAGWLLDVCFHTRWWDYSNVRFNFHGYICLPFSIIWGLAVVFVVKVVQPVMESENTIHIPEKYGWPMLAVMYAILIADVVVTVMIVAGLNRKLKELDDIRKQMRIISDDLSRKIGGDTIEAQQKIEEGRVKAHLAKAELKDASKERLEQLRIRREELENQIISHTGFGTGRLLKAFPDMVSKEHGQTIKSLQKRLQELQDK